MKNKYNFRQMKQKFYQILADERGATMLEYGMMLAGFGVIVLAGITLAGGEISAAFADGLTPSLGAQLEGIDIERP